MQLRQEPRRSGRSVPPGFTSIWTTPWADESSDEDPSYEPSASDMRNAYASDDESSSIVSECEENSTYVVSTTRLGSLNPLYMFDSEDSESADSDW